MSLDAGPALRVVAELSALTHDDWVAIREVAAAEQAERDEAYRQWWSGLDSAGRDVVETVIDAVESTSVALRALDDVVLFKATIDRAAAATDPGAPAILSRPFDVVEVV